MNIIGPMCSNAARWVIQLIAIILSFISISQDKAPVILLTIFIFPPGCSYAFENKVMTFKDKLLKMLTI
ncbi:MAG: hypothetical protein K2M75_00955 [Clostridia bacterium]|nr:hypothetical protein [Clostridia bacterium]